MTNEGAAAKTTIQFSSKARFFVWAWDASDIIIFDGNETAICECGDTWTLETVLTDDWIELVQKPLPQQDAIPHPARDFVNEFNDLLAAKHKAMEELMEQLAEAKRERDESQEANRKLCELKTTLVQRIYDLGGHHIQEV